MEDVLIPLGIVFILFIGLPWVVLHYVTRWKTAATLTTGDEALLEELYQLARRLDQRMDTVERLTAAEHPDFHPARPLPEGEAGSLAELDALLGQKELGKKERSHP